MRRLSVFFVLLALGGCSSQHASLQQTVVFFQTGEATLTPEGRKVVAQLTSEAKGQKPSRIMVEGRANGGTPHDAALADQRATVVIHALVDGGVDARTIERHPSAPPPGWEGPAAHQVVVTFLP